MARKALLVAFSCLLLMPVTGAAQPAPVAPPFSFDPRPERAPRDAAVALMDGGRFVLVWTVPTASRDSARLFARPFDAAGRPTSGAILLAGPPAKPEMAVVARGAAESWIVVWQDREGLVGRRFDAGGGTPLGEVFTVVKDRVYFEGPAICSDAAGRFVVAWRPATTTGELFARRFDADANRRGGPLTVAHDARGGPSVACSAGGRFAVGWITNSSHCLVAFYGGGGHREGDIQRVSIRQVFYTAAPRLAMTPGGELAVVWGLPPHTRYYDAAGRPLGPPVSVAPLPGDHSAPWDIVSLSETTFLLLWADWDATTPFVRVVSERFDAATGRSLGGGPLLSEVWGSLDKMRAGSDGNGHLALTWGPYAQVFNGVDPGFLELDRPAFAAGEKDGDVVFTVRRSGGSGGAVDVDYATVPVTARPGDDYVPASGTLSFPAGDSQPRTLSVRLLDDPEPEAEETVALVLSDPTGGAGLGNVSRTELAIRDDEQPSPLRSRGSPIEVSPADPGPAETPVVAVAADGSFAVAWRRGDEVVAQRFTRRGEPQGALAEAGMASEYPALAAHRDGGFSLVWQYNSYVAVTGGIVKHGSGAAHLYLQHASRDGVWGEPVLLGVGPDVFHGPRLTYVDLAAVGRKRLVAGGRLGGDRLVTLIFDTAGELMRPRPAVIAGPDDLLGAPAFGLRPDGSGLVLAGEAYDGSAAGIAAALVRGDGRVRGGLFPVNDGVAGIQEAPDVAALASGSFLAVWRSNDLPGEPGYVAGRLLTPEGVPLGPDLRISTSYQFEDLAPKVAALGDDALVVWEGHTPSGATEIRAQVVTASGPLRGRELRIGGPSAVARYRPDVAANAAGQAVVVWLEVDDFGCSAIRLQRLR